jgi:hypothetical protein
MRGNSGVILMRRYEIQVLSSYNNITYADGAAGGMYGLYPPMVHPCRPEGEWNTYDIVFKAPRFNGNELTPPTGHTFSNKKAPRQNQMSFALRRLIAQWL